MEGIEFFGSFFDWPGSWDGFRQALQLGGVMANSNEFRSNYVMWRFPETADITQYGAVIETKAPVYEAATSASPVLTRLSNEVVLIIRGSAPITTTEWERIEFRPGKTGYIRSAHLGEPVGYGVILELRRGAWRITTISSFCD